MKITKRLEKIANLVEEGKSVIDIGTDHGLVPLYLAKNEISNDILATDISKKSLQKLEDKLDENLKLGEYRYLTDDELNKLTK